MPKKIPKQIRPFFDTEAKEVPPYDGSSDDESSEEEQSSKKSSEFAEFVRWKNGLKKKQAVRRQPYAAAPSHNLSSPSFSDEEDEEVRSPKSKKKQGVLSNLPISSPSNDDEDEEAPPPKSLKKQRKRRSADEEESKSVVLSTDEEDVAPPQKAGKRKRANDSAEETGDRPTVCSPGGDVKNFDINCRKKGSIQLKYLLSANFIMKFGTVSFQKGNNFASFDAVSVGPKPTKERPEPAALNFPARLARSLLEGVEKFIHEKQKMVEAELNTDFSALPTSAEGYRDLTSLCKDTAPPVRISLEDGNYILAGRTKQYQGRYYDTFSLIKPPKAGMKKEFGIDLPIRAVEGMKVGLEDIIAKANLWKCEDFDV